MRKITLLLIFCLTLVHWSYSQCTTQTYQYPPDTVTINAAPGIQVIAPNSWPQNEYSVLDGLVIGEDYTVSTDMATPFYITVTEDDGTTVIVHGADPVSFTATTTGIIIYWTADALCTNGPSTDTQTQIECTTCVCNDTAPIGAATPVPADMATGVDLIYSGADILLNFDWDDDPNIGSGTYTLSLGLTMTGDDIGSLAPTTNSAVLLNYPAFAENTTYYWKIDTDNCAGSAAGTVWSFTTGSCGSFGPGAVATVQAPMDMATNVDIDATDPANLFIPFAWDPAPAGDPATSYTISLGANPAGDDIGTLTSIDTDVDITYTWATNTTYYWFVTAQNCGGFSSASPVYSFTTQANLSAEEFSVNSISVFPNPVVDKLQIRSDFAISGAQVYNILGKQVINLRSEELSNNSIDMSTLKSGVYFLKINANGKEQTMKVIKE